MRTFSALLLIPLIALRPAAAEQFCSPGDVESKLIQAEEQLSAVNLQELDKNIGAIQEERRKRLSEFLDDPRVAGPFQKRKQEDLSRLLDFSAQGSKAFDELFNLQINYDLIRLPIESLILSSRPSAPTAWGSLWRKIWPYFVKFVPSACQGYPETQNEITALLTSRMIHSWNPIQQVAYADLLLKSELSMEQLFKRYDRHSGWLATTAATMLGITMIWSWRSAGRAGLFQKAVDWKNRGLNRIKNAGKKGEELVDVLNRLRNPLSKKADELSVAVREPTRLKTYYDQVSDYYKKIQYDNPDEKKSFKVVWLRRLARAGAYTIASAPTAGLMGYLYDKNQQPTRDYFHPSDSLEVGLLIMLQNLDLDLMALEAEATRAFPNEKTRNIPFLAASEVEAMKLHVENLLEHRDFLRIQLAPMSLYSQFAYADNKANYKENKIKSSTSQSSAFEIKRLDKKRRYLQENREIEEAYERMRERVRKEAPLRTKGTIQDHESLDEWWLNVSGIAKRLDELELLLEKVLIKLSDVKYYTAEDLADLKKLAEKRDREIELKRLNRERIAP